MIAGCGYVGTRLAVELESAGHAVWALRRRAQELPERWHPLSADLTDARSLRAALERAGAALDADGFDAVVYAAAADGRTEEAYRAAYRDGLARLLEVLGSARALAGPLLFVSSTGVYGQDAGEWVDEDSPVAPRRFTGRLVLEGEQLLRESGAPGASVRLGGIYGPGRTALLARVRSGSVGLPPPGARFTNRIHRDDAAALLHHLIELHRSGNALHAVYLGVDHEPADLRAVLLWMAQRLGVELSEESSDASRAPGGKRCSNARVLASGYRFRYPTFREGYAPLLVR